MAFDPYGHAQRRPMTQTSGGGLSPMQPRAARRPAPGMSSGPSAWEAGARQGPPGMVQQQNGYYTTATKAPADDGGYAAGLASLRGMGAQPAQRAVAQKPVAQPYQRPMVSKAPPANIAGYLSDEESKTGIKDYNADDGEDWNDTLDKYGAEEQEKPKEESGGGLMGAFTSMLSDRHSKTQINRLEGANTALTRALSTRAAYPDTSAPSTGMQALGQQSAAPSHASFPDSAHTVAAQNQAMAPPQPQAMAAPQSNPFAVNMQRPNLDELDEAYKRLGQGG